MRERITEIIGLIMIFTGLFGICMILTSCEDDSPIEEESTVSPIPTDSYYHGDGDYFEYEILGYGTLYAKKNYGVENMDEYNWWPQKSNFEKVLHKMRENIPDIVFRYSINNGIKYYPKKPDGNSIVYDIYFVANE